MLLWLATGSATLPQPLQPSIAATAVLLDPADPAHLRVGGLRYLGGWQLESRNPAFGGYSALAVSGDRFMALNDSGQYVRFRMVAPGQIDEVGFGNLPDYPGRSGHKSDRDSESMTIAPDGHVWVGFEVYNAIYRYSPGLRRMEAHSFPPAMNDWPKTTGAEAMVRLPDGRFLVFAEHKRLPDGANMALLFPGDPAQPGMEPIRFGYRPPEGYLATDAAMLPDGRVAVLNRHFALMDGLWAALTIVDPKAIRTGETIQGQLAAELRPPLSIDNMEGLAVAQEGGRTVLWMISDDNQSPVQRTLLLKFALLM